MESTAKTPARLRAAGEATPVSSEPSPPGRVARVSLSLDSNWPGRSRPARTRLATRPIEADDDDYTFDATDGALYEKLRSWRREEAIAQSVPPYVVFSDKVLREIARQKPQSEDELLGISGIGSKKVEKYATALLEVLEG